MILIKTPLRISLFGGGTDFPHWYESHQGKTISFSINKYCYLILREMDRYLPHKFRLRYYKNENKNNINDIQHPVIREALKKFLPSTKGIEIIHTADLPARTGLGSSSAFTVSLIHGLMKINRSKNISKKSLWNEAINLEQNILREFVGSQDQIIVSEGGINIINYSKKRILISKIKKNKNFEIIKNNSFLLFLGRHRSSQKIEESKINSIKINNMKYKKIFEITSEAQKILLSKKKMNQDNLKLLFEESWRIKKSLSKLVSNSKIDYLFNYLNKKYGAYGKILGAGGGGFALIISENKKIKSQIMKDLIMKKNICLNYDFDFNGSEYFNLK
jgi:D-glycero-alpha-D-manno-heptose-7-phosphate kinase